MKITGPFSVTMKPLDTYASPSDGASLGRMSIDKEFSGPLEGTSQGEMLTGMSLVKGSAGYVAIEKVKGSLAGKTGTFVLQHFGIMSGTESRLILEVIPDSGTEELTGLTGKMEINNENGQHSYVFDYEIG
ncbi:DUF3224 domain-containing protein [Neolewinella persica]|uniref:DUF3224 domain-containing protein n=1 Tax=Neolewinella persica TaxID=70998 RepID=UPI00037ADBD8|nr:DUF3224 domain-containing protein [Neolewinella persica]